MLGGIGTVPSRGEWLLGVSMLVLLQVQACSSSDDSGTEGDSENHAAVAMTDTVDSAGATLTMSVRGDDASLPVLLVIHGGPGYAMLELLHDRVPELEKHFVLVSYDQRGAGLSYSDDIDPATMTLTQFVADADAVRAHALSLLDREGDSSVYVMGHSMGTMIGLDLVKKHPERYAGYVGVGQVVAVVDNEQASYDFAHAQAEADGNQDALDELDCVGRPADDFTYPLSGAGADAACDEDTDGFAVTNHWIGYYGGDQYGKHDSSEIEDAILSNPVYADHVDQWSAGSDFSAALFDDPKVITWDARQLHSDDPVPLHFLMGRHDFDTPAPLVQAYVDEIRGPHQLVWFENSAHFPFYEEPAAFVKAMAAIADEDEP
jgi:pimeloyl-ACP methyl ester carboxylesterase